jgi:putative transposase
MAEGIDQPSDLLPLKEGISGLMPSEMRRLRDPEDEKGRLKNIATDLTLDREMLQDVIRRKL